MTRGHLEVAVCPLYTSEQGPTYYLILYHWYLDVLNVSKISRDIPHLTLQSSFTCHPQWSTDVIQLFRSFVDIKPKHISIQLISECLVNEM